MPWNVLLCQGCQRAFGTSSQAKSRACPHCNNSDARLISSHDKASNARDAVALANTPPEIRNQLAGWMAKEKQREAPVPVQSIDGDSVLAQAADEEGICTLAAIELAIAQHNSVMDAESFIESACAQGELLRLPDGRWRIP